MKLRRFLTLVALAIVIYIGLRDFILPKVSTFTSSMLIADKEVLSCSLYNNPKKECLDDLAIYLSGLEYDKRIAMCVEEDDKVYCLGSNITTVNGISIVYFDKICDLQKSFDPNNYSLIIVSPDLLDNENCSPKDILLKGFKNNKIKCEPRLREKILEFLKE